MPDLLNSQVGLITTEGEETWGEKDCETGRTVLFYPLCRGIRCNLGKCVSKIPTAKKRLYDICKSGGNYDETGLTHFMKTGRKTCVTIKKKRFKTIQLRIHVLLSNRDLNHKWEIIPTYKSLIQIAMFVDRIGFILSRFALKTFSNSEIYVYVLTFIHVKICLFFLCRKFGAIRTEEVEK
jgi:hypothetical protein